MELKKLLIIEVMKEQQFQTNKINYVQNHRQSKLENNFAKNKNTTTEETIIKMIKIGK